MAKTKEKAGEKAAGKSGPNKKIVLLDSHAIIHRAYHALPDFKSSKGEATGALYGLSTMLMGIIEQFKPDYIIACYDLPGPTHRHEVYKEYKAGRKASDDELKEQLNTSRKIFEAFDIPIYDKPGYEADDMLGTIVEQVLGSDFEKKTGVFDIIIASGDMDTLQLVSGDRVKVYTLKKGIKDTIIYNEKGVKDRFGFDPKFLTDYKGLRGDPSDNIIGISGIGEKTATSVICAYGLLEDAYKALKKDKNKFKQKTAVTDRVLDLLIEGEDDAMFSKALATIRRDAPITFTLPEITWKDGVSIQKIKELFTTLEFRSLSTRLNNVFSTSTTKPIVDSFGNKIEPVGMTGAKSFESKLEGRKDAGKKENKEIKGEGMFAQEFESAINPELLHKLKVSAWVLNSNLTNPSFEEIETECSPEYFSNIKEAGTRGADGSIDAGISPEEKAKLMLKNLEERIERQNLNKIYKDIELPLIPVVEEMHKNGVAVDVKYFAKLSAEYHTELTKIEKKIWELSGQEFNIASPKQLGEILYVKMGLGGSKAKKTSTGAFSTKESELEKMKDSHPIIPLVFEHRELSKLLGTYVDTIPALVKDDGRVHAWFVQTGSRTGRMSSQDPNLQNIPIKTELGRRIRNGFVAEKGSKIVSFDYSQIELRIAAMLSKDEKLTEIFKNGLDVHTAVAAQVFKVPLKEVTKDMRRSAKTINFGVLFGMGVNALKSGIGGSRQEAQEFYNNYFETYTELSQYLVDTKAFALKNGFTETFYGRRRYFEGIKSKIPFIRASAERMAINAPIQGTEADVIKIAMSRIYEKFKKENLLGDVKMLMQVHDALVFEIKEEKIATASKIIKELMEGVLTQKETDGIPITVDRSVGQNWGELEDVK